MKAAIFTRISRYLRGGFLLLMKVAVEPFLMVRKPSVRMASLDGMRYPYFLAIAFATQGPVIIPVHELGHASRLFGFWRTLTMFRILPDPRAPGIFPSGAANANEIEVHENYFDSVAEGDFCAPYFAHPEFYRQGLHELCRSLRQTEKTARLFFAGTHSPDSYREVFHFPMLSRTEILERLRTRYDIETDRIADVRTPMGNVFRFALTSSTENSLDKHQLELSEYLRTVASADFFLCPPGFMVPHSHNLVEAMSVGSIPVCNYGEYMRPPLVDGVNCLAFTSLEDLDSVLGRIDAFTEDDICRLRQGVIDYYDAHLDPSAFARTFLQSAGRTRRLVVNAAEEDKSLYRSELPRAAAKAK